MPGPTHILGPKCLYIGREGEELLTASGDGRIQTWDLRQGPLRARVSTGVADVIRAEFSDGGKYVAVLSAASECVLCRLGLGRGEEFARVCREDVDISAMALAHGTYVTCTREGRMRVWDVGSMALLSDLHVGTDVICVGVASQRRVIVGGWEGRFSILDLTRGETKQMQLRNHVAALSLPGRGDLTAVRDMEGLQVWDIRELRRTVDLPGHYSAFALAENGASVAVGSEDKVKMVDSLSGECIRDLTGLVGCAEVVVYGHHDTMVAAGNSESQVLVWKV
jgi:WD40 repeat protein